MQIRFLPWAGLTNEIQLGPVLFWPFQAARVPDSSVREYLGRYFSRHLDHRGRPVQTVVICSYGGIHFNDLEEKASQEVRAAVDVLVFSIICPNRKHSVCADNDSFLVPNADRLQIITQNFSPSSDDIAIDAGGVLSGGWKLSQVSFHRPWSIGGDLAKPDSYLLAGFSKVFEPTFPPQVRERLFRSLEWFRFAHTGSDEISSLSKLVMMATAFEILLDIPPVGDKSGWFADEIHKRCGRTESITETRQSGKGSAHTRTKVAWWAWDFYKLRNSIVHGDNVGGLRLVYRTSTGRDLLQSIVADLVFWECVVRELYNHECIGEDVKAHSSHLDKLFPDEPAGSAEKDLVAWRLGFKDVHQTIGWSPASD